MRPGGRGQAQSAQLARAARLRTKGTSVATAVHAGTEKFLMLRILNTKLIDEIHDQWCRENGYPVRKLTSSRAHSRKPSSHKLRAQAGSLNPQALRSGNQGTSVQAGPGHKQQG